jgi:hypothetical protein
MGAFAPILVIPFQEKLYLSSVAFNGADATKRP